LLRFVFCKKLAPNYNLFSQKMMRLSGLLFCEKLNSSNCNNPKTIIAVSRLTLESLYPSTPCLPPLPPPSKYCKYCTGLIDRSKGLQHEQIFGLRMIIAIIAIFAKHYLFLYFTLNFHFAIIAIISIWRLIQESSRSHIRSSPWSHGGSHWSQGVST
jgi:hypothetical protein